MDLIGEPPVKKKRTCREHCRRLVLCVRVSPCVPLIGAVMVAAGLPMWAVFTRAALATTEAVADGLFGGRTAAVEILAFHTNRVTGLGVIIVSAVVGVCLLVSLLRTLQEATRLPSNKCAAPGRLSYGTYATLLPIVTFSLWLMVITVALVMAAQLAWLLLAFVFEGALLHGVTPPVAGAQPQALVEATREVLSALSSNAKSLPASGPLSKSVTAFADASKDAKLLVCPATCVDLGSFAAVFKASNPCVCGTPEQHAAVSAAATNTWKNLVHALASLAFMGLAALFMVMNLSAQFAHARRDIRELPRTTNDAEAGDGAVYVTTNPTFSGSPRRSRTSRRDIARGVDKTKPPMGASYGYAVPDSAATPSDANKSPRQF